MQASAAHVNGQMEGTELDEIPDEAGADMENGTEALD